MGGRAGRSKKSVVSHLGLPPPAGLERRSQALAILDAILCPDWVFRHYSFNKDWSKEDGHRMGSMRDGSGDDYFILFTGAGAAIKGYAHEAPMAQPGSPPPGIYDGFPQQIKGFLTEPAFSMQSVTFCLWCPVGGVWSRGKAEIAAGHRDPDGSRELLGLLSGDARDYQRHARDCFEVEVPLASIESVYAHEPLTDTLLQSVRSGASLAALQEDLSEIGYPR